MAERRAGWSRGSNALPDIVRSNAANLPDALRGGVVAIGNFDGVHRGHRVVLDAALAEARSRAVPALVLTFEPHPREVFGGEPVFRLTPPAEKARVLGLLGFDGVVEQPFDRDYAGWSADDFIDRTLIEELGTSHVVVGDDFRFGAKRAGNAAMLRERPGATVLDLHHDGDDAVSSSRVRAALRSGRPDDAARLLDRRWRFAATVSHGRKVGRTIGYPTANMELPSGAELAHGIYAVRYRRPDGTLHNGVASHGRRPTFDDGAPLFETFLFDFEGDLYGEEAHVTLFARLRGEEKFDGVEALIAQMDRDSVDARRLLNEAEPLSPIDAALNFERGA